MRRLCAAAILFFAGLAGIIDSAAAEVAVPPLKARVTDLTGTLTREQQASLEQKLAEFEARKGAQIGVLLLPTTKPEAIEQFAVRVQEVWRLGRKGIDDGVLLVVARDDRALRIEVGYGLEGALPDAIAKRIIEEDITPPFRQGDFYAGISAGITRIMNVIDGEPLPPPRQGKPAGEPSRLNWLFPAFMMLMIGRGLANALFGRLIGSGVTGGVLGWLVWMFAGSLLAAIAVGVVAFLFSMASGVSGGRMPRGWGGGFPSSGGWSSGGGGFRGGGGFSGGGGASGRW
jgi:uncharacterized protein